MTLERGPGGFGFTIKANTAPGPLTVGKITDGGAAEQDGQVHPGDRIVSINGSNTRETTKGTAWCVMRLFSVSHTLCVQLEEAISLIRSAGVILHMQLE